MYAMEDIYIHLVSPLAFLLRQFIKMIYFLRDSETKSQANTA